MEPIVVSPPLKGEWNALNTPGDKVPSHGTHEWGMAYAYDFFRIEKINGVAAWHRKSTSRYLLGQVKLSDTFGWGEPIYSPIEGVVREVVSSIHERNRLHVVSDLGLAFLNGLIFSFKRGKPYQLGGNYLIIEGKSCCAFIAHAKTGSIHHEVGDRIRAGDQIAEVGHSGNSTVPHLHFQLMDRVDIRSAKGLPCSFSSYEVSINDVWEKVVRGVPGSKHTIRFDF
ncbi:MAG: M23 family metallopeptidase [bacterium]